MSALAFVLAIGVAPSPVADTLIDVRRGDRVLIESLTGDISISTWDRDVMEVRGEDGDAGLSVRRNGSTVQVVYGEGRRRRHSVEAMIRVPRWIDVEIGSTSLDLSVRGLDGALRIGNVNGDVYVENVGGAVDVRSIRGEITIVDARAGVRASSQSDDVTLTRVQGPVEVHSGDGDILLDDVRSTSVRAETQDGDIVFHGSISAGGDYGFFVHDGDATIAIPESTSARLSVSTFDGEFQSDFPVRVERFTGGREFDFVLGSGAAAIRIEVFDGEIRLLQRR